MKYSPSMVDGQIVRLSVSQLSRFDTREKGGCKLKWWYKYVGKMPEPPSRGQLEGIDGHKRFENYYNGQAVVWMDMDMPAVQAMPKPGPNVKSEVQLEKLTCLRIPFQGSIDLVDFETNKAYDFKFQAQIRAYTEPTAQLWGYLEELRLRDNSGGRLSFNHVYIQKKPPYRVKIVEQAFEPREVERNWGTYGSLIKEMHDTAKETDPNKVEANTNACYAYGPCPYIAICHRGKPVIEMSFLDDLKALKNDAPAVTLPEVKAAVPLGSEPDEPTQEHKALPPDAPPADAVPAPVTEPLVIKRGRGRPRKLMVQDIVTAETHTPNSTTKAAMAEADETPDSSPTHAPKLIVNNKMKALRLGITLGMPGYSSISAAVEMEGPDEEALAKSIETAIMRRLEKLTVAFNEALTKAKK